MSNLPESKQLFHLTRNIKLHDYYSAKTHRTRTANAFPFIAFPNDQPCHLANLYLLSLLSRPGRAGRQGLSNLGSKGGTLGDYAAKVTQLLRYCYSHNINITALSDADFSHFINSLLGRKKSLTEKSKRSENTVIAIGRINLDFLSFTGELLGLKDYVSQNGTIRAIMQKHSRPTGYGSSVSSYHFHHHSFPTEGRRRTRNPITDKAIVSLHSAADNLWRIDQNYYLLKRRHILLDTLEHTGARISEVAAIRITDVMNAWKMKHPMLRLDTMKREPGAEREVPVTKMYLSNLVAFIRLQRRVISSKFPTPPNDYLFISETTGKPLLPSSLSGEILKLKTHASIKDEVCPHTFRHKFITNHIVHLIKAHQIKNQSAFLDLLFIPDFFLNEVKPYTGHKNSESVRKYFQPAFAQVKLYSNTIASVHTRKVLEFFDKKCLDLADQLSNGTVTAAEYKRCFGELLELRNEDLLIALDRAESLDGSC